MTCNDTTIRVETFEDFDRELARDSGDTLEVEAYLAKEYGLFPEDVGTDEEIVAAWDDPHGAGGEEVDA
ncbi:MAG: hypothetical protein F4X22_09825 [Gemmatimonadales bacterium]|nr:hypothetical protein [Gemmatimonadota bacterium]MXW67555.1 hypothetical protein [Candidatus Palauibacter irciniicola]MXX20625.1 hypothetical protein [Cenarchaeum sp. SB0667_bin_13]MYC88519.1 hypothetical protein [Candidatus Palauibacter denitrificans]MYG32516.1 hypothetical protein [Cenarchaeum sp. SB0677_bin_16]